MDVGRMLRPMVEEAEKGWGIVYCDAFLKWIPGTKATAAGSKVVTRYARGPVKFEVIYPSYKGPVAKWSVLERVTVVIHVFGTLDQQIQDKYTNNPPKPVTPMNIDVYYPAMFLSGKPLGTANQWLVLTPTQLSFPHDFRSSGMTVTRPMKKNVYLGRVEGTGPPTKGKQNTAKAKNTSGKAPTDDSWKCVVYFELGAPNWAMEDLVLEDPGKVDELAMEDLIAETMRMPRPTATARRAKASS